MPNTHRGPLLRWAPKCVGQRVNEPLPRDALNPETSAKNPRPQTTPTTAIPFMATESCPAAGAYLVTYRYFDGNDADDSFARPLMISRDRAACEEAIMRWLRRAAAADDSDELASKSAADLDFSAYAVEAQPTPMYLDDDADDDDLTAVPGADAFEHVQSYAADAQQRYAGGRDVVYTIWRCL